MTGSPERVPRHSAPRHADDIPDATDRVWAARALAILRVLLLPIVLIGDRLVSHPTVGVTYFDTILGLATIYSVALLIDSWSSRPRVPNVIVIGADLALVAALAFASGGAFAELRAAFLALPLGAALLLAPTQTALVTAGTAITYLVVAFTHPATRDQPFDVTMAQGLYVIWIGVAAVVLASLLAARRARIVDLARVRGALVAQAVEAEERAQKRVSDALHDQAIQDLLTARQDLADIRDGDMSALPRAENAVALALAQLRDTVRELNPYLLDHLALPDALRLIAEQQAERAGYGVTVNADPSATGDNDRLIAAVARELLVNVSRHACARQVKVTLTRRDDSVVLEVTDDGRGFTPEDHASALRLGHIGLAASRERVEASAGSLEVNSALEAGTQIICAVPVRAERTLTGLIAAVPRA